jgi:hypothetical protein
MGVPKFKSSQNCDIVAGNSQTPEGNVNQMILTEALKKIYKNGRSVKR